MNECLIERQRSGDHVVHMDDLWTMTDMLPSGGIGNVKQEPCDTWRVTVCFWLLEWRQVHIRSSATVRTVVFLWFISGLSWSRLGLPYAVLYLDGPGVLALLALSGINTAALPQ